MHSGGLHRSMLRTKYREVTLYDEVEKVLHLELSPG